MIIRKRLYIDVFAKDPWSRSGCHSSQGPVVLFSFDSFDSMNHPIFFPYRGQGVIGRTSVSLCSLQSKSPTEASKTRIYTKSHALYKIINDRCQVNDTDSFKCCNNSEELAILCSDKVKARKIL